MPGSVSPLQVIKQRELDLRQQVEAARRQAEARLYAARVEGEQSVQRADQAGRSEASACYQDAIDQAYREAKAITTAANEEATALRLRANTRLDEVAVQIVELVYAPFNGESSDHRDEAMPGSDDPGPLPAGRRPDRRVERQAFPHAAPHGADR